MRGSVIGTRNKRESRFQKKVRRVRHVVLYGKRRGLKRPGIVEFDCYYGTRASV
jgi:hypothetical protein